VSNMSLSISQSVSPGLSELLKVCGLNAMFEADANVPAVPLSPELSSQVEGMSMRDECERTFTPSEHDLARQLRKISFDDDEYATLIPSIVSKKDEMLSCNSSTSNIGKQINLKHTQNDFRERWVTYNDKPKYRSLKALLYKTKICYFWKECGYCVYGENCIFAHGLKELRMLPVQHKKL